jgi:hypothetical protein
VATYDYPDEHGDLAFQVLRKEGIVDGEFRKTFLQRRPDPSKPGGWDWTKGDTSILYRLPELLASDPAEIVWRCAGEKDADRLTSLGLTATTAAGGEGKWTDAQSQWLAGRRVVVLQDNDAAGETDVQRAMFSIGKVATSVAPLLLPNLPPKGDVSDWLDAGGTVEELIDLGEAALAHVATLLAEVVALPVEHGGRPEGMPLFPTDMLPPSMARLVENAARALSVPPEFVAVPLMVLAGAAIGNAWMIETKKGWKESPALYAAVVGDPGSGKTPALKLALKPLVAIQDALADEYRDEKRQYDVDLANWESENKKTRGAKPEAPRFHHVWTTDPTTEVLAEMLVGTKGLAYTRDELAGWVAAMDAYRSGKGADRQHFLSMWAGASIKIDRKSRPDPIRANNPCLSIVGGIQPDKLPSLIDKGDTDDGFLDRMLWAYPDTGSALWNNDGVDETAEQAVADLFVDLHRLKGHPLGTTDVVIPNLVRLDPAALGAWELWFNEREAELKSDGFPASLKGTWAKLPAQLARVTLILHIGWAIDAGQQIHPLIPIETVASAMDLMEYFKEHARFSLASARTSRATLEERILRILSERGPCTTRSLYEAVGGRVKSDRLNGALERLLEDGRVECHAGTTGEQGGRPAKVWSLPIGREPLSLLDHRARNS